MALTVRRGSDENADDARTGPRTLAGMSAADAPGAADAPDPDPPGAAAGVVLAEPVRQRLLQLAAEVLGRLQPDEVPASLRVVARFTPARRARRGSVALAAALDADDGFRNRVAEVVAEAAAQLVDALHAGTSTAASDPVDTAVVAYLVRPQGWREVVADASARWTAERAGREAGAGAEELARVRDEVADLRARARGEAARVRAALDTAGAEIHAEAEQLRRTLRLRTGELRAAERARDEASARVAAVERRAADAQASHDDGIKAVQARVKELERGVEGTRRATRLARDLDDARVRLLLDTMTGAAAGLRRELALPAGTLRPADALALVQGTAGQAGDANRTAVDVAALDRLLELPQVHVVVDGYNVTKTGYPDLPLVGQRNRLVTALAALQARTGVEITVAFDGSARPPSQPRAPRGVRVLFSAEDELADDLIRRLVAAEPQGRAVVVVTTDAAIVSDVLVAGAWTVPSVVLVARLA